MTDDKLDGIIESIMMYGQKKAPITMDYKITKPVIDKYRNKIKKALI